MIKELGYDEKLCELSLVPLEEQPYSIPKNWTWVRLENVVDFFSGSAFPKNYQGMG